MLRRTRFITLLFLVLSLAFFGVREFRQALLVPLAGSLGVELASPLGGPISLDRMERVAATARENRDAAGLAFAALHLPAERTAEIRGLADQAVSLDPTLAWIYLHLASRTLPKPEPGAAEAASAWATRLIAWDPRNAAPHLLRAQLLRRARGEAWPSARGTPDYLALLEQETEWRTAMETAFAKPSYDYYSDRRFELERRILRQQGWDYPVPLVLSAQEWPVPDFSSIRDYANLLENKRATDAEAAGRRKVALEHTWRVAHFGERLRLQGHSLLEWVTGNDLRNTSYERLLPLLESEGRTEEAATLRFALAQLRQETDALTGKAPLTRSSNFNWSAVLLNVFAGLVVFFLVGSLSCVLYVVPRGGYGADRQGRFWRVMLVGQNYMTLLLFVCCVALFLTYYPYAQNFSYYLTAEGPIHNFEPLFYNTLPSYNLPTARTQLELENPLRDYAPWALGGVFLLALVIFGVDRWEARKNPKRAG